MRQKSGGGNILFSDFCSVLWDKLEHASEQSGRDWENEECSFILVSLRNLTKDLKYGIKCREWTGGLHVETFNI
jgi:hypothetical protein